MKNSRFRPIFATSAFALSTIVFSFSPSAQAVPLYWDLNGTAANTAVAVTGAWDGTNAFWNTISTGLAGTPQAGTTSADDLFFSVQPTAGTAIYTTGTVSITGAKAASSVTFRDNIVMTLSGSSLTVGGTGTTQGIAVAAGANSNTTISAPVILANTASTFSNGGTGVMTFSGGITGTQALIVRNNAVNANGITISGASALNISNTLTNSGTGEGGVLISAPIGALVTGVTQNSATSSLSLSGTNLYTGATTVTAGALSYLNTAARSSTLTTVAANATLGFGISGANAFTTANVDSLFQGTFSGVTNDANSNVGIDTSGGDGSYTTTGAATTRGLTKMGANVLTLSITPGTYSGPTSVRAGTLALAGDNSATTSNISVLATGALRVTDANSFTTGTLTLAGNGTNTATLNLLNDTGTNFAKDVLLAGTAHTINVDRAIGGSGTNQVQTIGTVTSTGTTARTVTVAGANGYTLNIGTLSMNSGTGQNTTLVANVDTTVGTVINPMSGFNNTNFDTLTLSGTAMGNSVVGVIADAVGGSATAGGLTRLTKTGAGTWTINNANTYAGITTIGQGILNVNSLNSVVGGTASSTLGAPTTAANGTIGMGGGTTTGILNYTGSGEITDRVLNLAGTTGGSTITQAGSGLLRFTNALTATGAGVKTLTLNGSSTGNGQLDGAIVQNSGTNTTALAKSGTNTWRLNAANTYTGATTISGGTLALGATGTVGANLAASAVTVNSGGTLAVTPGIATTTNNSIGSSLTLNAGSAFTAADGFNTTFNVTGALNLYSGTAGVAPTYSFNVSGTDTLSDRISSNGAASFTNAGALISIVPTAALTIGHTFTVADAASGLNSGNAWTLASGGRTAFGNTAYSLALTNNATSSVVSVTGSGAAFAYYKGNQGGNLNTNNAGNTNWATDVGGLTDLAAQPNALSDVFFSATGATNLTVANLGQNYVFNSLNFNNAAGAVSISDTGAFGITVNGGVNSSAGAPAASINVPVTLGGTQTWTNNSSNTLSFNNTVAVGGSQLTTAGTGSTVISNLLIGSGGLFVNAGSTVISNLFSGSGGLTVNAGSTTVTAATLSAAQTWTNNSTTTGLSVGSIDNAGFLLTVNGTGTGGISGVIGGGGGLTASGTGTLTLSGSNNYTGATIINSGIVVLNHANAFGDISSGTTQSGNSEIRLTGGIVTAAEPLSINGGGINNAGTLRNISGNNTYSGPITMAVQSRINSDSGTLTLSAPISVASNNLLLVAGGNGNLTILGEVATGTNGVSKDGGGTLTLSGANLYTGASTVSAGTLKAGSAVAFTNKGTLSMSATGIFDLGGFASSFTNVAASAATNTITNTGSTDATLNVSALGTQISALLTDGPTNKLAISFANANSGTNLFKLDSPNTFSGGITLLNNSASGTRLRITTAITTVGSAGAITSSPYGKGAITIGQVATDRAGILFDGVANNTLVNALVFNTALGSDVPGVRFDTTGNTLSGSITANLADATFSAGSTNTGAVALTGKITGTQGLALTPAAAATTSALTVTLNSAGGSNDYAGNTTISKVSNSNYTLALGAAEQIPNGSGKGNVVNNGTLNLNGFSETINGLSGNGAINGGSGTSTLTVGDNDAASSFGGTINNSGGNVALTKIGNGLLTLGGTNTYTGLTRVNGGTLALGASGVIPSTSGIVLGGGTFDVSAKAGGHTTNNLSGNGAVIGAISVSTQLSIGASAGTMNFQTLTLGASSTYLYELTGGGTSADLGLVATNLTLSGGTLDLVQLAGGVFTPGDKFTLFGYSGSFSGTFKDTSSNNLAEGATFNGAGGNWQISYVDTNPGQNGGTGSNFITIVAIPEPSTAGLLTALGAIALLRRRRA